MTSPTEQALLSLLSPAGADDPYSVYRQLHQHPVAHSAQLDTWFITGAAESRQALLSEDFPVVDAAWMDAHAAGWRASAGLRHMYSLLPFTNEPTHSRIRRLISRDFTARRVEALRPVIEQETERRLDELAERGMGGAPVDFLQTVAYPVTVAVIAALIGVPPGNWNEFRQWSDDLIPMQDPRIDAETKARTDRAAEQFDGYFRELISVRKHNPAQDLLSAYLMVHDNDPDRLSGSELFYSILLLVLAGYVTTADSLGNSVHALLSHPDQFVKLCGDASLVDSAVDEALRWAPSVQQVRRYAARDVRIGGVTIPAEETVRIVLGAANRDPAECGAPDDFDITRDSGQPHLEFGLGGHFCLGRALARLELQTVVRRFAARFPDATFAAPPVRRGSMSLAGFTSLPLTLGR